MGTRAFGADGETELLDFKFTVSISPFFLLDSPQPDPDLLNLFASDPLPIWRMLFDVHISPKPYVAGGMHPYFLSAAPIRRARSLIQALLDSNVRRRIELLSVGKSGAQMHEGFSSTVDTSTNWPEPHGPSAASLSQALLPMFPVPATSSSISTRRNAMLQLSDRSL